MRHSAVGPSTAKPKSPSPTVSPTITPTTITSASNASSTSSPATVVKVYATDNDTFPLGQFEPQSSVAHILHSLAVHNGGLKVKGGSDTFASDAAKLPAGDYVLLGSAGLKLRVVWKSNKMMVPYAYPTHVVGQLLDEIACRFSRFHSPSEEGSTELKMAELRTIDGFLINKYDKIMDVVADNEILEAIDFDSWLKEQSQLCKDPWLQIRQTDFVDGSYKWAQVGKHKHGKLFVQLGHANVVDRLELFEVEDLKMFAKEGQQQILIAKGSQEGFDWHASASFTVNASGQVTAVTLEVKSLSDPRPLIKEIKLNIANNQLSNGDIRTIQTCEDDTVRGAEKPLPASNKVEVPIVDKPSPAEPLPLVELQTPIKLKVEQVEQVFADQSWASGGSFYNRFYLHFSFTNPTDNVITVTKVKTEYEASPGNWVAAKETATGYKNGVYDYRWDRNTVSFSVGRHSVEKVAILCCLQITAPQIDTHRRAHSSLPHPLKIRTILEDDQGTQAQIEVLYYNKPYDLPTKQSIEKYNSKTYDFWAQLDDVDTETRHYVCIAKQKDNNGEEYLDTKVSFSGSSHYLYKQELQRLAFDGLRKGLDIVPIADLAATEKNARVDAYALIDTAAKRVYAFKWVVKSNNASLEEYYRIPHLAAANN